MEFDLTGLGVDLLDFWRDGLPKRRRITLRRMRVLIDGLPESSLFWSAVAGHRARWGPAEWIAVAQHDAFVAAHFKDAKPYPRPGEAEQAAARVSARAERWRQRQQAGGATS